MSKLIRLATKHDIPHLIELLKHYSEVSPIIDLKHNHDIEYINKFLISLISGLGVIFIAYRDDEPAGMIIAVNNTNIWNPKVKLLQELAYWVEPKHRNTTIAYRLLHEFKNYADDLLSNKKINAWTISKLVSSPDLNYEKLGTNKLEEYYICQQP